jgi:phospholipid/cholesterol/gamma-HCH transport system permease protein
MRPTRQRRQEFVRQSGAILRASLPAAMLSIAAWGFAGPGLQAGNFLVSFGSIDRSGGFMAVAIVREFGTYVTATVVAGIVGTMFTAELGSRSVRGELDALVALGVDPVADMVAPRPSRGAASDSQRGVGRVLRAPGCRMPRARARTRC